MGCGSGKSSRVVNPSLDFVMESSGLAQADLLFQEAVEPLQQVKSAYTTIEQAINSFKALCKVQLLKDPSFTNAIKAFMYCLAGSSGGDLERVGFRVVDTQPFITFNRKAVPAPHSELADHWLLLADRLIHASSSTMRLSMAIEGSINSAQSLDYNSLMSASNLTVAEASKVMRICQSNLLKLKQAPPIAQKTMDLCNNAWADIKLASNHLTSNEAVTYMKDLARRTAKESELNPELLIQKFWPNKS
jgi:hypothetical protein